MRRWQSLTAHALPFIQVRSDEGLTNGTEIRHYLSNTQVPAYEIRSRCTVIRNLSWSQWRPSHGPQSRTRIYRRQTEFTSWSRAANAGPSTPSPLFLQPCVPAQPWIGARCSLGRDANVKFIVLFEWAYPVIVHGPIWAFDV